jgi:gamma-glutamyltranspeptidase
MHLEVEAMRVAFADLYAHVADPAFMKVSVKDLLSKSYARERAKLIDPKKAGTYAAGQPPSGGTIYLCASDADGRMISLIQSNFKGFGSGVVVPNRNRVTKSWFRFCHDARSSQSSARRQAAHAHHHPRLHDARWST